MNLDAALKKLKTSATNLGQVKFNKEQSTFSAKSLSTFRDATPVEQNLLNLWTGEPKINMELERVLQHCNMNRHDISCLMKLADLLDKVALYPQLRPETERMLAVLEEKRFEYTYLRTELEKDQQSLYNRPDESPAKFSTHRETLSENEKNYAKQCIAKIKSKKKQIDDMKDQVQENMNIRNDLTQVILAKEEDEMKVLQEETGMLLDEIEEIKRVIEDYEEKYNAQQEEAENKPQSPISETPIEETDFNKTFKQLEEGLNVLLLTDNNDNDDTQASNEDLDELKHELNEISKQLEEQEKDTGLLSRAEEYADKLSMMIKTAIHHANTQNQELEETQDVEKLRQILPEPTYELSDAQKLKTSILAAVQQDEMSLQELKADLKLLGFKEIDIVTAIYKLNTNGFIVVDRDSAVTMVKCIYPFDA